jgi:hypothetical protein
VTRHRLGPFTAATLKVVQAFTNSVLSGFSSNRGRWLNHGDWYSLELTAIESLRRRRRNYSKWREKGRINCVRFGDSDSRTVGGNEGELSRIEGPGGVLGDVPDVELGAHNPFVVATVSLPTADGATLRRDARSNCRAKGLGLIVAVCRDRDSQCSFKDERQLGDDWCFES